jgi:tRNA threonylcarbamoyl adenosine modification protein YjeE
MDRISCGRPQASSAGSCHFQGNGLQFEVMGNYNDAAMQTVISESGKETESIGLALGTQIRYNLVIALKGELGAGKTTLTRGIVAGLGIKARVTSPTFTLINEYMDGETPNRLLHMDTYRLGEDPLTASAEVEMLGLGELLDELDTTGDASLTVLVIEWADRLASWLPEDHLEVRLEYGEPADLDSAVDRRIITLIAHGARSAALIAAFAAVQPVHFRS